MSKFKIFAVIVQSRGRVGSLIWFLGLSMLFLCSWIGKAGQFGEVNFATGSCNIVFICKKAVLSFLCRFR